jgi:hypothetical protein
VKTIPDYLIVAFHDGISKPSQFFEFHNRDISITASQCTKSAKYMENMTFIRFDLLTSHDKLLMQDDNWHNTI